jgi:hypothetical protein
MRGGKEIREALKRLKDEHLEGCDSQIATLSLMLIAMVSTLEWFWVIERGYQISSNDCQDCRAIKNKVDALLFTAVATK